MNESLKNSISYEKMNVSCEDEFKKNGNWNDSFQNNTDNSYGDSYSTMNSSNMDNEKNKTKNIVSKEKIEYTIIGEKAFNNNEMQIYRKKFRKRNLL